MTAPTIPTNRRWSADQWRQEVRGLLLEAVYEAAKRPDAIDSEPDPHLRWLLQAAVGRAAAVAIAYPDLRAALNAAELAAVQKLAEGEAKPP